MICFAIYAILILGKLSNHSKVTKHAFIYCLRYSIVPISIGNFVWAHTGSLQIIFFLKFSSHSLSNFEYYLYYSVFMYRNISIFILPRFAFKSFSCLYYWEYVMLWRFRVMNWSRHGFSPICALSINDECVYFCLWPLFKILVSGIPVSYPMFGKSAKLPFPLDSGESRELFWFFKICKYERTDLRNYVHTVNNPWILF